VDKDCYEYTTKNIAINPLQHTKVSVVFTRFLATTIALLRLAVVEKVKFGKIKSP
jgi:hypothetical protein